MSGGCQSFRIAAPPGERERLIAELHARGTLGVHEEGELLVAYFPLELASREILALAEPARQIRVSEPVVVAEGDWLRRWREGLGPRQLAGLWIRPSWCQSAGSPELVIDPEQAFGSGEHATTRGSLRLLLEGLEVGDRVLDVGTGSGILALAALRRGARWACAIDVDPLACTTAAANARRNRLALALIHGGVDAVDRAQPFDAVVANLLPDRLLPLLDAVAERSARSLVVSGFLERDRGRVLEPLCSRHPFVLEAETSEEQHGDRWGAARLCRTRPAA